MLRTWRQTIPLFLKENDLLLEAPLQALATHTTNLQLENWLSRGISGVRSLLTQEGVKPFPEIVREFNIPARELFTYLRLKNIIQESRIILKEYNLIPPFFHKYNLHEEESYLTIHCLMATKTAIAQKWKSTQVPTLSEILGRLDSIYNYEHMDCLQGFDHNRLKRNICPPNEYLNEKICCKNCSAGTSVKTHCTQNHGNSVCAPCTLGEDYTEYPNGLDHCLNCRHCTGDKVQVKSCTLESDAVCQCKQGTFCPPGGTCEVCKRCKSCSGPVEKNCTATSNTVCETSEPSRETKPPSIQTSEDPKTNSTDKKSSTDISVWAVLASIFFILLLLCLAILCAYRKKICNALRPKQKDLMASHSSLGSILTQVSVTKPSLEDSQKVPGANVRENLLPGSSASSCSACRDMSEEVPLLAPNTSTDTKESSLPLSQMETGDNKPTLQTEEQNASQHPAETSAEPCPNQNRCIHCSSQVPSGACTEQSPQLRASPHRSQQLTENEWQTCFTCIVREVPFNVFNTFMRTMNLKDNDIERINSDFHTSAEKHYQMLLTWRQQQGYNASIKMILDALAELKLIVCRDNVVNSLCSKNIFL
ncbi:tumor necrosis factor receptor superfamily member 6-like [Pelobates cultripes]|uniref:Tumor necrosis factor receptor superfamily member 6-like n=1 Tax=Pelobates cultripes TaxID=61616 RepID=A0AAD1TL72_PELCU|nr:tumor necrosis factor receptor superfamily member 6-like [Pelobates cultripes]